MQTGTVGVNGDVLVLNAPFGGVKGRGSGPQGARRYLQLK